MNTIVVRHADALDALARLYPTDAQLLSDAASHLRHLSEECQRLRDAGRDENNRVLTLRGENVRLREERDRAEMACIDVRLSGGRSLESALAVASAVAQRAAK